MGSLWSRVRDYVAKDNRLERTAISSLQHYQRGNSPAHLTESIQLFQNVLNLRPPEHLHRPKALDNLANAILARYKRTGSQLDLTEALELHEEALILQPPGHPGRSSTLNNLANAILARYQRDGNQSDMSRVVELYQEALALRPSGHPDRPSALSNLANVVLTQYERDGGEPNLSEAIRLVLNLLPPGHPNRSSTLNDLARASLAGYRRTGNEPDLVNAVETHKKALALRPSGHPGRSNTLSNLANAMLKRYDRAGGKSDLKEAIRLHEEALALLPHGHPDRSTHLSNLANSILRSYEEDGEEFNLSKAIELHREALALQPLNHPHQSSLMSNIANAILKRYERGGAESDLSEVITLHNKALTLRPLGHPDRPSFLTNLAYATLKRYEREGEESDLLKAIELHREALDLYPSGDPDRWSALNNLGNAILTRFERDGGESDLSEVIKLHREALDLLHATHPRRSVTLNNLGGAIIARYRREGIEMDLSEAIELHRDALALRPPGHPHRSSTMDNLGSAILVRYERSGGESDLLEVIGLRREALDLLPPGNPYRSNYLHQLASAYRHKFLKSGEMSDFQAAASYQGEAYRDQPQESPLESMIASGYADYLFQISTASGPTTQVTDDLTVAEATMMLMQIAATAKQSPITHRLQAALRWVDIALELDTTSVLEAYQCAFTHLGSALTLPRSLQDRHENLLSGAGLHRPAKGLALEAALWAVAGAHTDAKLAIELLDQGRNMLLASVGQFRADLGDVRRQDPTLADDFYRISQLLDAAVLTGQEISKTTASNNDPINRYKQISADWQAVVDRIRLLPGCESFLLTVPYVELQKAAVEGPVIIILVGAERSEVVIVMDIGEPHTIDLPQASEEVLKQLYEELEDAVGKLSDDRRASRKLPGVLSQLWQVLVRPIVHELRETLQIPLGSRIWWYPTSWASFLPLHAAGSFKTGGENVPDLYISSYTPTLQALRTAQKRLDHNSEASIGSLVVSQPQTPGEDEIVCVVQEVEIVRRLVPKSSLLSGEHATKESVLKELRNHSWIHFACHGHPDPSDPFKSHFSLHDGPLSLQEIIANDLPSAEFAYLSACNSAAQDRTLPDEGLTLAGGMQFAGFKSVVGTLWEMADEDAPTLARVFYMSLAKRSGKGKAFDCTKTAEALHDAVKKLREQRVPLFRWVNLVHYGI